MNAKQNAIINGLMKTTFAALAVALLAAASAEPARAQVTTPSTTLNYSFSVPVAKAVPNPCSGGFELITGNQNIGVATTSSSSGFSIAVTFNSSGKGEDALSDGTLILNGTQLPKYVYSSTSNTQVDFPTMPSTATLEIPVTDSLARESGPAKTFMMQTVLSISFTNGVPAAPVLTGLAVGCQ